jgi:hypothetical protein
MSRIFEKGASSRVRRVAVLVRIGHGLSLPRYKANRASSGFDCESQVRRSRDYRGGLLEEQNKAATRQDVYFPKRLEKLEDRLNTDERDQTQIEVKRVICFHQDSSEGKDDSCASLA